MEDQPEDNSGPKMPETPLRDHGAGYPTQPGATNFSLPPNAQFTFPPVPYYTNTPIQPRLPTVCHNKCSTTVTYLPALPEKF